MQRLRVPRILPTLRGTIDSIRNGQLLRTNSVKNSARAARDKNKIIPIIFFTNSLFRLRAQYSKDKHKSFAFLRKKNTILKKSDYQPKEIKEKRVLTEPKSIILKGYITYKNYTNNQTR